MFFDGISGRINYRIWRANGDVRAVMVFLHGLGQCSADYHRYGRAMSGEGIEVWALDHIGHGLSEGDHPDPASPLLVVNAELFLRMAASDNPGVPLVLAGHSLGAGVSLLVMHNSGIGAQQVRALVLTGTPTRDVVMRLPGPNVPTLLLHGSDDRIAAIGPVRQWAAVRSSVEIHELQNAGHDLLHEPVHGDVQNLITEFVHRRLGQVPVRADVSGPYVENLLIRNG